MLYYYLHNIYRKWKDGQTFRPARIHLFCVCIGADSVDSADSTISVTETSVVPVQFLAGTPGITDSSQDVIPSTRTDWLLPSRNDWHQLRRSLTPLCRALCHRIAPRPVLHARVMRVNLRKKPISADQSQRVSQNCLQITLTQFRVSHFVDYPYPRIDDSRLEMLPWIS